MEVWEMIKSGVRNQESGVRIVLFYVLPFFLFIAVFFSCKTVINSELQTPNSKLINEVYQKEAQYLKARVSNDFNTLYSFQHPEYRAIIDIEKFKSNRGNAQLDYSSVAEKNPLPRIFTPVSQFPVIFKDFRIEKFFIDKNGRYAKIQTIFIIDIIFPIAYSKPVEREVKNIDYWENLDGEWFILNKVYISPSSHISGAVTTAPINFPEEKAEYIEIPINEIESDKESGQ
jgi:hypothetical protein